MAQICNLNELKPGPPVVLTIGVFDGVHRGHQILIGQTIQRARALEGQSVVLTFSPHPRAVLAPTAPVFELTTLDEKLRLIAGCGPDVVAILTFTHELSLLSPEAFLDMLQKHINLTELWVGPDFALGHKRAGTVERLSELGATRGFTVHTVAPLSVGSDRVSSSRIRELVAAGDIEQATVLLGRYPRLEGTVVHGAQRGRQLGFPTANLDLATRYVLPANGIYAVYAELDGVCLPSVANIGVRPTFGINDRLVEVYILDFERDIYDKSLGVQIVKKLRDEVRFASIDALIEQMHRDVDETRVVLASQPPNT